MLIKNDVFTFTNNNLNIFLYVIRNDKNFTLFLILVECNLLILQNFITYVAYNILVQKPPKVISKSTIIH